MAIGVQTAANGENRNRRPSALVSVKHHIGSVCRYEEGVFARLGMGQYEAT